MCGVLTSARRQQDDWARIVDDPHGQDWIGEAAGVKARPLLDAFALEKHPIIAYVSTGISREQLAEVASRIAAEYPTIPVHPVRVDYTTPLRLPDLPQRARCVAFAPGSTIGTVHPAEASAASRLR